MFSGQRRERKHRDVNLGKKRIRKEDISKSNGVSYVRVLPVFGKNRPGSVIRGGVC